MYRLNGLLSARSPAPPPSRSAFLPTSNAWCQHESRLCSTLEITKRADPFCKGVWRWSGCHLWATTTDSDPASCRCSVPCTQIDIDTRASVGRGEREEGVVWNEIIVSQHYSIATRAPLNTVGKQVSQRVGSQWSTAHKALDTNVRLMRSFVLIPLQRMCELLCATLSVLGRLK